jgi:sec-independent protein translocase protein TatB
MFEFSLGEMLVVALVALIVLGPERLPKAARFLGLWARRARAHWHAVRNELEQELANEELQRALRDSQQALRDVEAQLPPLTQAPPPAVPTDEARRDDGH